MNRRMNRVILTIIIPLIYCFNAVSQQREYTFSLSEMFPIGDFRLDNANGYVIQAVTNDDVVDEHIEGIYTFVINGYIENVTFKKGQAPLSKNFQSSDIFYIKHEKNAETLRHLYYSVNSWTIPIPFWMLIIIPILFIVMAMFIKRILFLLLLIGFVLFFILQGMDVSAFINLLKETIVHLI